MNSQLRSIIFLAFVMGAVAGSVVLVRSLSRDESHPATSPREPITPSVADVPASPQLESDNSPTASITDASATAHALELRPQSLELSGPGDGCQLVVMRRLAGETAEDLTRTCKFDLSQADIAEISPGGYVRALEPAELQSVARDELGEGTTVITIGARDLPVTDFALDIVPILTKAGCNSGQCHGAAQGKGGLQLSLFGYDPESDHASLTRGLEGRRIDPFNPSSSLILLKPTLTMPHGGGLRLRPGSSEEDRIRRWIEAGAPWRDAGRGRLNQLIVEPTERFLTAASAEQQIQVIAQYDDGTQRDVTRLCLFVSNDPGTVTV